MAPNISEDWEAQLRSLKDGWDAYDGIPITEEAIRAAKRIFVVPCADGGIRIETHQSGMDIEIGISPSGRLEFVGINPSVVLEPAANEALKQ